MMRKSDSFGITGFGAYIPAQYVDANKISDHAMALGVVCKSRPSWDEDAVTMAVEASFRAINDFGGKADQVGMVLVGSESSPYAVKPISTIVADCLGISGDYQAVDLQFACKAATAGLRLAGDYVCQTKRMGLVVGSDVSQAKSGDLLECTTGAGAAALLLGRKEILATIDYATSYSSDTPDFWRRDLRSCPSHAGRFSGEPAYFKHVLTATEQLFKESALKPTDIDHAVFHMPNSKFPMAAAAKLGLNERQMKVGLVGNRIGNTYTASAMIGLVSVLEQVKPGQKILITSYGSGAGSDSFLLTTTKLINRHNSNSLKQMMSKRRSMTYEEYRDSLLWR